MVWWYWPAFSPVTGHISVWLENDLPIVLYLHITHDVLLVWRIRRCVVMVSKHGETDRPFPGGLC